jgi:hypothetical protein
VAGVGDFNGDGDADILWRNAATGEVDMWLMNGVTVASTATLLTDPNWSVAGVGDYTGDGRDDILWHNAGTGATVAWLMNGSTVASMVGVLADPNWVPAQAALMSG